MKKLAVLFSIFSLFWATPSIAEITKKYDEFKDITTVSLRPSNSWDGKSPTLFMDTEMEGKGTENQSFYVFSVIFKTFKTDTCASGVTGVIADGQRVKTMTDLNQRGYTTAKYKVLKYSEGGLLGKMPEYLALSERYYPAEFRQIANAQSVKYQLCGNPEWVYEVSAEEMAQLREYAQIVIPETPKQHKSPLDLLEQMSEQIDNNNFFRQK